MAKRRKSPPARTLTVRPSTNRGSCVHSASRAQSIGEGRVPKTRLGEPPRALAVGSKKDIVGCAIDDLRIQLTGGAASDRQLVDSVRLEQGLEFGHVPGKVGGRRDGSVFSLYA